MIHQPIFLFGSAEALPPIPRYPSPFHHDILSARSHLRVLNSRKRSGPGSGNLPRDWSGSPLPTIFFRRATSRWTSSVNRSRLGFEILANLLEGAEYASYENVIRRLLQEWINHAGTYDGIVEIERALTAFILAQLRADRVPGGRRYRGRDRRISAFRNSNKFSHRLSSYL